MESTRWGPCYAVINLYSYLNWLTYVADEKEIRKHKNWPLTCHSGPTDHLQWKRPTVWLPDGAGGREKHELPMIKCTNTECWRCRARAGGWGFGWVNDKWTPRSAFLAQCWQQESLEKKYQLKQIAFQLANRAQWPIGPHKSLPNAPWGWSTGAEYDGPEMQYYEYGTPMTVRYHSREGVERMAGQSMENLPPSHRGLHFVNLVGMEGAPTPHREQ